MSSMLLSSWRQALERVVLALDRDEHLARGDEGVDRQQPERRRAVDEDVVVRLVHARQIRVERGAQSLFARDERHQLDLGTGEVDGGGHAVEALVLGRRLHDVRQGQVVDQHVVDALPARTGDRRRARSRRCPAGRGRSRARGHRPRQRRGEVDRGRRLARRRPSGSRSSGCACWPATAAPPRPRRGGAVFRPRVDRPGEFLRDAVPFHVKQVARVRVPSFHVKHRSSRGRTALGSPGCGPCRLAVGCRSNALPQSLHVADQGYRSGTPTLCRPQASLLPTGASCLRESSQPYVEVTGHSCRAGGQCDRRGGGSSAGSGDRVAGRVARDRSSCSDRRCGFERNVRAARHVRFRGSRCRFTGSFRGWRGSVAARVRCHARRRARGTRLRWSRNDVGRVRRRGRHRCRLGTEGGCRADRLTGRSREVGPLRRPVVDRRVTDDLADDVLEQAIGRGGGVDMRRCDTVGGFIGQCGGSGGIPVVASGRRRWLCCTPGDPRGRAIRSCGDRIGGVADVGEGPDEAALGAPVPIGAPDVTGIPDIGA